MNAPRRRILLIAAAGVAGVVLLIGRVAGDDDPGVPTQAGGSPTATQATGTPPPTGSPAGVGEPVVIDPGHGEDDGHDHGPAATTPPPVMVRPTDPTVRDTAAACAAAWLNTYKKTAEQWRASLDRYVTDDLAAELSYADPASVPVGVVGSPINVSADGSLWDADVPILDRRGGKQTATLRLTLVRASGGWAVSEIDLEES